IQNKWTGHLSRALHYRFLEEPSGKRRCYQTTDIQSASRLAEDRHVVRVAAEISNILLYPSESENLIEQSIVARAVIRILGTQERVAEKAERPETIVDCYCNDSAF